MKLHPVCKLFPDMTDVQFKKLVEDIQENGQREPILTHNGKIVDGRHRYRACRELNIEPVCEEWDGEGSLVRLVVSRNLHRRHLSASQRAAVASDMTLMLKREAQKRKKQGAKKGGAATRQKRLSADLRSGNPENDKKGKKKGETRVKPRKSSEEAGELVGVSPRQVELMRRVDEEAPELVQPIKDGTLSVNRANNIVSLPEPERKVVLDRGRESGDYGAAYQERKKKQKPAQVALTRDDLYSSLKGAADSARECESNLKAAIDISTKIKAQVTRGRGIKALANTLRRCLKTLDNLTQS